MNETRTWPCACLMPLLVYKTSEIGYYPDSSFLFGGVSIMDQSEKYEYVYQKVSAVLIEAMNLDEDEIKPTATLQGDLGAESIDFLDVVFRLERELGIKIPRGELFPEAIFQGDPDFVQNGKLTDKGLEELRTRIPFADLSRFEQNPELQGLSDLFTVDMIVKYIVGKLGN